MEAPTTDGRASGGKRKATEGGTDRHDDC
jgi:hypothetical protein